MRLTHDEYFLKVLDAVRLRGTCDRGRNGALIVKDNHIISTGYVGGASGEEHCDDIDHEYEYHTQECGTSKWTAHCVRTIHAEINAIIQAARYGPTIDDAEMYVYFFSCTNCARAIINSGIKKVTAVYDYHKADKSKHLFTIASVEFKILKPGEFAYDANDNQV